MLACRQIGAFGVGSRRALARFETGLPDIAGRSLGGCVSEFLEQALVVYIGIDPWLIGREDPRGQREKQDERPESEP